MIDRAQSRSRSLRLATTWLAALLQVHLFFILQLHHHSETGDSFAGADQSADHLSWQVTPPDSNPVCLACQIARHTAVQPASSRVVRFRAPEAPRLALAPALGHSLISHVSLAGRDPPLLF